MKKIISSIALLSTLTIAHADTNVVCNQYMLCQQGTCAPLDGPLDPHLTLRVNIYYDGLYTMALARIKNGIGICGYYNQYGGVSYIDEIASVPVKFVSSPYWIYNADNGHCVIQNVQYCKFTIGD